MVRSVVVGIAVIFTIITLIGLALPSTVQVSRAVNIKAPADTIHHYLADAKYWKLWMDGAAENQIQFLTSKTVGVGTVVKLGTNQVSIEKVTPLLVQTNWKSEKGGIQESEFIMANEIDSSVTTVQWYFQKKLNWYPWERFGSVMLDKILSPSMEKSLANLKTIVEEKRIK